MTNYTNFAPSTLIRLLADAVYLDVHDRYGGFHWVVQYPNGYGFSAVKHNGSYGNAMDLWEVAVIEGEGPGWSLTYDTPITDDVIGYLSEEEVIKIADEIRSLK